MRRKILTISIIIAVLLSLFSCSSQTEPEELSGIEAVMYQIKMESMIQ